jgi:hypothetical protein
MEVYSVAVVVAFPVVESWCNCWDTPVAIMSVIRVPLRVMVWTITVIVDNERWIELCVKVLFIGEAEIFSFECFSLTEFEEDREEVVLNTSILPGIEVVCH